MARLRILLMTERHERALLLEQTLAGAHHQVSAVIRPDDNLLLYVQEAHPDALIIDLIEPAPDILQGLRRLGEQQPLPVKVGWYWVLVVLARGIHEFRSLKKEK